MAESSSVRRSGRNRQTNRKYFIDPYEELDGLSSGSEDHSKVQLRTDAAEYDDDDNDFANEQENDILDEDEVDHEGLSISSKNGSSAEEDDADEADEANDADGADDADAKKSSPLLVSDHDSGPANHVALKDKSVPYRTRARRVPKDVVRSRGLIEHASKVPSKEEVIKFMAGGHPPDWVGYLRAKDSWMTDPTLPRREGRGRGKGAMCHHPSHTEDERKMEATVGWHWYYDQGGRELFAKRQKTQILTPDEGLAYIPKPSEQSHKFLMGPYGNQQVFNLQVGHSMCLNDAWNPHGNAHEDTQPGNLREGWILNLGTAVKCLDWAPNQDGDVQYLAAATAQPKAGPPQGLSEVSPAYTPSPPTRSCIQIWEFAVKKSPDHETLLDSRQQPALQLLICTEWGEIKQLKWCQVPRIFRDEDYANKTPIGFLATVWSDGLVRVLDVYLERNVGVTASYASQTVRYDEPAFKAWAPNTLCTCVTWLSASNIAVGFANGFLAIWDISEADTTENKTAASSSQVIPQTSPWLYIPLHQSYILALTSAYPNYPHLLSTTSVDGYARLTDLRAPTTDYTLSLRSRSASPLLVFSPSILSMLSTEENDFARLFPLRAFHSSIAFARATGSPLCLAVNYFHPSVLMGCADGSLIATNPLPRVSNKRRPYYQQVIFRHEWTRGNGGTVGDGGISRITESYKVVYAGTFRTFKAAPPPPPTNIISSNLPPTTTTTTTKPQIKNKAIAAKKAAAAVKAAAEKEEREAAKNAVMATIHEENTGLTQVAWNPNLKCGGWMAAGMGSGLVRVQDLAV